MPLARGPRELKGGMHHVRLEPHHVRHALHKEGVPAAEGGHWQDAHLQLPIKAPEGAPDCISSLTDVCLVHARLEHCVLVKCTA